MNTEENESCMTLEQLYFEIWKETVRDKVKSDNKIYSSRIVYDNGITIQVIELRFDIENCCFTTRDCSHPTWIVQFGDWRRGRGPDHYKAEEIKMYWTIDIMPLIYSSRFTVSNSWIGIDECKFEFGSIYKSTFINLTSTTIQQFSKLYKDKIRIMILAHCSLPYGVVNFCILPFIFPDSLC